MTPGFGSVRFGTKKRQVSSLWQEDCQEDLAELRAMNLWLWQISLLIQSLLWCLSFPTIFNNQVQTSADGEAFGSCTSAPSVAFGPSISPQSPLLSPLAPLLFLLLCGFLFPPSLVICFPQRSSVCHSGCLGKQTGERALGEPDGMLRVSVCLGWSRARESFLKMCSKRSKAQWRECSTYTSLPPVPDVLSNHLWLWAKDEIRSWVLFTWL